MLHQLLLEQHADSATAFSVSCVEVLQHCKQKGVIQHRNPLSCAHSLSDLSCTQWTANPDKSRLDWMFTAMSWGLSKHQHWIVSHSGEAIPQLQSNYKPPLDGNIALWQSGASPPLQHKASVRLNSITLTECPRDNVCGTSSLPTSCCSYIDLSYTKSKNRVLRSWKLRLWHSV